jgi:hypothetical protein
VPRPTKEQAQKLRDQWLLPLTTYFNQLAGTNHLAFLMCQLLFRCINAANQAGKTTAMMAEVAAKLLGKHPYLPNFPDRKILVIITRTDQAATIWGRRLLKKCGLPGDVGAQPWIDPHYIKEIIWARSQKHGKYPGCIRLINGSEYYMALAGDPDSWMGLEGVQFDDIYQDEASGSENLMDELEPRLWWSRSNRPGGGGKVWGATETKDNEPYRQFKKRCQDGLENHAFFYFPYQENTSISEAVRQAAKNTMSAESFQVRALGVGSTTDRVKVIAPYWDPDIHERKEVYRIRPDDNLRITFDPGWKDKGALLFTIVSKDAPREIKVVRWRSYKFGGYNAFVMDMKRWLDGRTATSIVCDSQIHSTKQDTGETYYQVFCDLLETHKVKSYAEPSWLKPRLEDSIPLVQHCLQNHGTELDPYKNSIVVYTGDDSENTGPFIGELLNSRWQVDREGNVLKTMVQKNLEAFDCLRYEICHSPQWLDYGTQQATTDANEVREVQDDADPDLKLHRERMAAGSRLLESEDSMQPLDSFGTAFSW